MVYFTDSRNGLSFTREILSDAIGGKHPAPDWLNYERYDPLARIFLDSVIAQGADNALKMYREQRQNNGKSLTEAQVNNIGYILLRMKKLDDAIAVFEQNTADFPKASNTWDSLAEAYAEKGNKELAIKYYEKSVELDPGNTNGIEQLKKLR